MTETEKERLRYLNEKYDLHLRLDDDGMCFDEFVKQPLYNEDLQYTVHVFKEVYNDKKQRYEKQSRNLHTLHLSSIPFAKNNNWEDNKIILQEYLIKPERWKLKIQQKEGYHLVWAHDCKSFIIIDVDCEEDLQHPFIRRLLLKYPFYLSVKRKIPKIILPLNDKMPPSLQHCSKPKILQNTDVLGTVGNLWSFVPIDGKVFNSNFSPEDIHSSDYKDFPISSNLTKPKVKPRVSSSSLSSLSLNNETSLLGMTNEQFEACLKLIATNSSFNERGNWLNILIIIKRYFNNEEGLEYAKMFSKLVDVSKTKFDESNWIGKGEDLKTWESIEPFENGLTVGTLRYHAKMVDNETYNNIFCQTSSTLTYEERKLVWETTHFKILNPILYCEMVGKNVITRTPKQLVDTFSNLKCVSNEKVERFVILWMNDENIRTYSCFDFDPGQPREYINTSNQTVFNLYSGAIEYPLLDSNENTEKAFDMFITILKHLTGDNNESYNFLIKMIAHYITKPHIKTNFILLFLSPEGAGKGLVWNFIGEKLIGDNYYVITGDVDSVFGTFNHNAKEKLLIIIDEAEGKDLYSIMNRIKHQSTEDKIYIHEKYKPTIRIQNFGNYVFLTNNPRAVKIEETDRRFVCFEASTKYQDKYTGNDYQFLVNEMKTPEFISKAYHYFKKINLDDFNPKDKNIRPKTELYNKMKYIPQILHFFFFFFYERRSLLNEGEPQKQVWPLKEWWNRYQEFCSDNNFVYKNTHVFTTELKKYQGIFIERCKKSFGNLWEIDPVTFKQYCQEQKFIFTDYDDDASTDSPSSTSTEYCINPLEN